MGEGGGAGDRTGGGRCGAGKEWATRRRPAAGRFAVSQISVCGPFDVRIGETAKRLAGGPRGSIPCTVPRFGQDSSSHGGLLLIWSGGTGMICDGNR